MDEAKEESKKLAKIFIGLSVTKDDTFVKGFIQILVNSKKKIYASKVVKTAQMQWNRFFFVLDNMFSSCSTL